LFDLQDLTGLSFVVCRSSSAETGSNKKVGSRPLGRAT